MGGYARRLRALSGVFGEGRNQFGVPGQEAKEKLLPHFLGRLAGTEGSFTGRNIALPVIFLDIGKLDN